MARQLQAENGILWSIPLGSLLAMVTAASVDDAAAAPQVMDQIRPTEQPRLKAVRADNKYHNYARHS